MCARLKEKSKSHAITAGVTRAAGAQSALPPTIKI